MTSPILFTNTTLTSSQIKNIHSTPIELVAAPGSGQILIPVSITTKFVYGGNDAFIASSKQEIVLFWGSSLLQTAGFRLLPNVILTNTASRLILQPSPYATPLNDPTNQSLIAYNSFSVEISGNSSNDNYLEIAMQYYVWTL